MTEHTSPAPATSGAVIFIIGTIVINALGFGIIIPVLPTLLMDLANTDAAGAALWGGAASFVFAVMQFLFSPVLGGISDRFGRRPVLLMSLAALAVDFMLMGLAHALWVFFLARMVSGIFAATNSTANAYIADTTPEEQRATRFGWVGAAFGVGFILGPAIGGVLSELGPRVPFFAAAAIAAANAAYGYFFVPESLTAENRRPFSWSRANPFGTFGQLGKAAEVGKLAWVYFLTNLSGFVYPAIWAYAMIAKFGWSEAQIGWSLAFYGVCFAFSQAVVIPFALPRLGERRAIWLGLVVEGIALVGVAFASSALVLYLWLSTSVFSGMQGPAIQKLMTSRVNADQQGELQGGLSAISGLVLMISPLLYTQVFFAFARGVDGVVFVGAPFLVAALFNVAALILFFSRARQNPAT